MKRIHCYMDAMERLGLFRMLAGMLMTLVVVGCAGRDISTLHRIDLPEIKGFLGLSQYYVKSQTTLWSRPDRSSELQATLSANTKVTEITRDTLGWSRVRTADTTLEGWLPTALLSEQPVSSGPKTTRRRSKESTRKTAEEVQKGSQRGTAEEPEPVAGESGERSGEQASGKPQPEPGPASIVPAESEATVQTDSRKPSGDKENGGLLGAPPADAATPPSAPPAYAPPAERKSRPEYFEPF
jgi:hypothetical protein